MRDIAVVAGILISCIVATWLVKSRVAEQYVVRTSDVPAVFQELREQGSDGAFAVFMFSDHGKLGEENNINLQFSIESGKVGLDWVLLAPVNVRDERRVFDFLKTRGSKPRRLTKNGVAYLRAEEGDLVQLCQHIMSGLYGVKRDEEVDFLPDGFKWTP